MSDYGVTDTGFKLKPQSVIIEDLESLMKASFGQDLDVSAESPEGQIIATIAEVAYPLWELAQHAYNAYNPSSATGVTLENLVKLNNLTKKSATSTTVYITFYGNSGVYIPQGTSVSSNPDFTNGVSYTFTTTEDGTLVSGECTVLAICSETGAIQIPTGAMTILDTNIVGVTSVTNESIGSVGSEDETDPELRSRRTSQVSLPSVSTTDSIRAGLLDIESVLSAKIYENDSAIEVSIDGVSVSPHAMRAIVQGGEAEQDLIANAIYVRKDPGVPLDGDIEYTVVDSQGFDKKIKWDTPNLVPIYITIDTVADSAYALADDGEEIREAIVEYVEDAVTGYNIGDDVKYGRLFTPINSISGHDVQSLKIGIAEDPEGTSDLVIDGGSLAVILDPTNDIVINITYT